MIKLELQHMHNIRVTKPQSFVYIKKKTQSFPFSLFTIDPKTSIYKILSNLHIKSNE